MKKILSIILISAIIIMMYSCQSNIDEAKIEKLEVDIVEQLKSNSVVYTTITDERFKVIERILLNSCP